MSVPRFGVWLGLVVWALPASAAPLSPDDAVRAALARDPRVIAATSAVRNTRADLRASGFLRANPTFAGEVSLTSDRVGASIEQPVSLSGEGIAAHTAARRELAAADAGRDRTLLLIAAEARLAWSEAAAAGARAALAARILEQAGARRTAIEARVAAGDAATLDARLARLDETRAAAALVVARNTERDRRTALAAFVVDAATVEIGDDPLLAAPTASGVPPARSDVRAADADVLAAEASLRAARASAVPPVTLGAFVERDDGELSVGPTVGLTLPLWHQAGAGIEAARADLAVLTAERDVTRARADAEINGSAAALVAAEAALLHVGGAPAEDAEAALVALDEARARGELDGATTTLLRAEVLDGWSAAIDLHLAVAEARILALLAAEDPALLPPDLREVTR